MVCCYANASPVSQEEIKADNSSSNSFLLHPSVMPTTAHILERKRICFLVSVCVCAKLYVFSSKECLSELYCDVTCRVSWGGGRMKISALSHTRVVRLCVERGLTYSTEQLLWQRRNRRREKEQQKIKPRLLF